MISLFISIHYVEVNLEINDQRNHFMGIVKKLNHPCLWVTYA